MNALTKGDIIIFKAEDSWFSKAIAVLTHSDVCHAAMVYSEDSLVEVGANGVVISRVDIQEGDGVYVLRLASQPDAAPLIRSADTYLAAKTRYDFPGLVLLAGVLIYRYITPSPLLLKTAGHILDAACLALDNMLQRALKYPGRAVVCSQLVYQIFYDCGDAYRIQVSDGCLWDSLPEGRPGSVRLFDQLCLSSDDTFEPEALPEQEQETPDTEALAKELYLALSKNDSSPAAPSCDSRRQCQENTAADLSCVVKKAECFLSRLKNFLKLIGSDTPMDSLFVTPADILYHSSNLKREGMLTLTRIH